MFKLIMRSWLRWDLPHGSICPGSMLSVICIGIVLEMIVLRGPMADPHRLDA